MFISRRFIFRAGTRHIPLWRPVGYTVCDLEAYWFLQNDATNQTPLILVTLDSFVSLMSLKVSVIFLKIIYCKFIFFCCSFLMWDSLFFFKGENFKLVPFLYKVIPYRQRALTVYGNVGSTVGTLALHRMRTLPCLLMPLCLFFILSKILLVVLTIRNVD